MVYTRGDYRMNLWPPGHAPVANGCAVERARGQSIGTPPQSVDAAGLLGIDSDWVPLSAHSPSQKVENQ